MAPVIKIRPNMPKLDELYTGVADDAYSRIASSIHSISEQARQMGVGPGLAEFSGEVEGFQQEASEYPDYEFESDEEQRLAQILSQEEPEAELGNREASFALYPDYGAIMCVNRRTGSVQIATFDNEEDMFSEWDACLKACTRREY